MLRVESHCGTSPEDQVDRPSPAVTAQVGRELHAPAGPFQGERYASLSSTDLKTKGALLREKGKEKDIFFPET